jgi:hypothetical protein
LTVSFPEDDTAIGAYANDLRQALDAVTQRSNWQELALRAFQTWAVHADINVGLRSDHNLAFGSPGLTVADPRFGDFRIGAFPQKGVLANSIPFQAVAGTSSGDILINSAEPFTYHDWAGGVGPDPSSQMPGQWDLFSVLLHESGNALGVDDNSLNWTVMFRTYTVPKGVLSQDDIDGIQALYGARSDPFETISNDQLVLATLLPTPAGFQPASDVLTAGGSLGDADDVDHYQFTPLAGQDRVTIRLKASGISLLKSRVEVLDANGQVLAQSIADSVFDNDHAIHIDGLQNQSSLFIRVSSADQDVFSVGDYQLTLDYRDAATQAGDIVPGGYDSGVDSLFTNFELADSELGDNDTVATASVMDEARGITSQNRFEIYSAVSSASDIDLLRTTAPVDASQRLLINVASVGLEHPSLRVRVVDGDGAAVGALGRMRADGTWTLEVAQPQSGQDYFVRVSVDPSSTVSVGNYVATVEYVLPDAQMNDLASGDVSSTVDDYALWTNQKSKLLRFDLAVQGASNSEAVQLTIYDAHTHEVAMVLVAQSARTRTAFAWLAEGDYILRFTAVSRVGSQVGGIGYALTADGISDDQNPEDEPDPLPDPNYYDYYDYVPEDPMDPPPEDPYYYNNYYYY